MVTGDFYVAIEYLYDNDPNIGTDTSDPNGRSYSGTPGSWWVNTVEDFMIRAEIECTSAVGGVVYSPNTLGLLSPLLMVAGLIGAIVIGSFAIKKRRI